MAEEIEAAASDPPAVSADPAAMALGLAGASRAEADAFLKKQSHFIDLQTEHLHEQRDLLLSRLRLGRFSDRAKAALQVMTAVVGAAIAGVLVLTAWNAAQTDGMVLDAFSVPPQLAASGVTGEVVASDLTGKIGAIRDFAARTTLSATREVSQDSAEEIKVEIPETGVSMSQAWRYLRLWLGHERHLSGNLRLAGDGKATLTVMLDGAMVASVSGAVTDLDKLEQQAAEQVFGEIDPKNMVLYLRINGRAAETLAAAERAAQRAIAPADRADIYSLWSDMIRSLTGDIGQAAAHARVSEALYPKLQVVHWEFMWEALLMGHDEDALHQAQSLPGFQEQDQPKSLQGRGFAEILAEGGFVRDALLGAFAQAATEDDCETCSQSLRLVSRAEYAARAHDGAASRALVEESSASESGSQDWRSVLGADIAKARYYSQANVQDWPAAVASARVYQADIRAKPAVSPGMKEVMLRIGAAPLLATALAKNGDVAGAEAAIAPTPGDCYACIRARGAIAAAAQQWARADWWFARAVAEAPSIPFAYSDWGRALLDRNQPDAAIEKFTIANKKGPHFADALQGLGEALMAKNRSHLALAKFSEAEKYAPNWGRLHLKWGEALVYAGKTDEAKAQFARAAGLDLTPSEKAELARHP